MSMDSMFEEFSSMTIGQLKDYLNIRGLKVSGVKNELVSRAFVAWEQKVSPKVSEKELQKNLQSHYIEKLQKYKIPEDPRSIPLSKWQSDVKSLPKLDLGNIFSFILEKKEFDIDFVGKYKTHKAFSYWKSGFVDEILTYNFQNIKILRSMVTPSQSINNDPREVWIAFDIQEEQILTSWCSCIAGMAETCNHVIATLYKVEYANTMGFTNPSCTSLPCNWNASTKRNVQPSKVTDMNVRKDNRVKSTEDQGQKSIISEMKTSFDPRRMDHRKVTEEEVNNMFSKLYSVTPRSVVFKAITSNSQKPVMPQSLIDIGTNYTDSAEKFIEGLPLSNEQVVLVEQATRDQAKCPLWHTQRKGRITASSTLTVCTKFSTLSKKGSSKVKITPLVKNILHGGDDISFLPAVKYGIEKEDTARVDFLKLESLKHSGFSIRKAGLYIKPDMPFLAASPDGIIQCNCCGVSVLEIKCPYVLNTNNVSVQEGWHLTDFLEQQEGNLALKSSHKYYYQIQAQLGVTGLQQAFFVVWSAKDTLILKVKLDKKIWMEIVQKASLFFKIYIVPYLLGTKNLTFCPLCNKLCLDGDEIIECGDHSICCDNCDLWFHWKCVGVKTEPTAEIWTCNACAS